MARKNIPGVAVNADARATLETWRAEIEGEIAHAEKQLADAIGALAVAEEAERVENDRVTALRLAVAAIGPDKSLACAIDARLRVAVKAGRLGDVRGAANSVDAARFKLTDLHDAITQITTMLGPAPRAMALLPALPRPVPTPLLPYEPIQMPARLAPAVA